MSVNTVETQIRGIKYSNEDLEGLELTGAISRVYA